MTPEQAYGRMIEELKTGTFYLRAIKEAVERVANALDKLPAVPDAPVKPKAEDEPPDPFGTTGGF